MAMRSRVSISWRIWAMRQSAGSRQSRNRGQLTQQQGEQRGFSGAVGTDQAGFVTGVQGQLGVFKKTLRATL